MNAPFDRYGLAGNPYRQGPLDCLKREQDHAAFLPVAAFAVLSEIDKDLITALADGEPRFYLITGLNGSGRTSVANCLIERYRGLAGIAKERLIIPKLSTGHAYEPSALGPLRMWLNKVNRQLQTSGENLSDSLRSALDEERKKDLVEDAKGMAARANVVVASLFGFLDSLAPKRGFATLIEDVPNAEFARAMITFFDGVPTVCVFTTSNQTEAGREVERGLAKTDFLVPIVLPALKGDDAVQVIRNRWASASALDYPFVDHVIREWCGGANGLPVGRILHVISKVLEFKINRPQANPLLADVDLTFTEQEFRHLLCFVEDVLQSLPVNR